MTNAAPQVSKDSTYSLELAETIISSWSVVEHGADGANVPLIVKLSDLLLTAMIASSYCDSSSDKPDLHLDVQLYHWPRVVVPSQSPPVYYHYYRVMYECQLVSFKHRPGEHERSNLISGIISCCIIIMCIILVIFKG